MNQNSEAIRKALEPLGYRVEDGIMETVVTICPRGTECHRGPRDEADGWNVALEHYLEELASGQAKESGDAGMVALRVEVHADGVSRQQVKTAIQAGLAAALGGSLTTIEIRDTTEEEA